MKKIGIHKFVKTKNSSQTPSNTDCPTVISLAELLANFPVRRPLYTYESGALCYQLLDQLRDNFLSRLSCSSSVGVTSLKYPTLANILLTDTGSAFVKSNPATAESGTTQPNTIQDWLIALAYTLRNHTLVTSTHDSDTFRTLVESLGCARPSTSWSNQLLERIHIWQTTCLFLCSLNIAHHDTDRLLETLHQRSNHAQNYRLCSGEMKQKRFPVTDNQSDSVATRGTGYAVNRAKQPLIDCISGTTDREAFGLWVERWKYVNAEYLARQLVLRGSKADMASALFRAGQLPTIRADSSPQQSPPAQPGQPDLGCSDRISPIFKLADGSRLDGTTEKMMESCHRPIPNSSDATSEINASETYMHKLRSMYSNLISRPLSLLLQKRLKDARGRFSPEMIQQSSVISNTLRGLNRLLQNPSLCIEQPRKVEIEKRILDPKCDIQF